YTAASGTLTFAASDTSETFTVTPTSDTTNESNETITVTLATASGATIGSTNNPATITLTDNDSLTISSPSFTDGGNIPVTFTCNGSDVSPALNWVSTPSGTQSFYLQVRDIDADNFVHWAVKNISASSTGVAQDAVPTSGVEFFNDFGLTGWGGPCPPVEDGAHTYQFTIYALDTATLSSSTVSEALTELSTHILEQHSITGEYDA
ncbi:MAG: hypothetical protein ACD_43C00046G0001, partial [uncultured bacterium]